MTVSTRKRIKWHATYLMRDIERAIKQHMNIASLIPEEGYEDIRRALDVLGTTLALAHDLIVRFLEKI